jgi:hypothetical protein
MNVQAAVSCAHTERVLFIGTQFSILYTGALYQDGVDRWISLVIIIMSMELNMV